MSAVVPVLVIAVMVTFNALYVAAEFATVGSRRSRVQEAADGGSRTAAQLLAILRDPKQLDSYVAACQIGITLSSLVAGAYGQAQLTPLLEPRLGAVGGRGTAIVIVLVLITAVQVVLGELLPKTAALRYPERLAMATIGPMKVSRLLFRPLVAVFNGSAFRLMRLGRLDVDHSHAHVHSPEELAGLYRASAAGGLIDASERDMLAGILNVDDRVVREIMTPRPRLTTVPGSLVVADALARVAGDPHTRFPVTDRAGEIVGIVHLRDLFVEARQRPDRSVLELVRPVVVVPEMVTVPSLWRTLRDEARHCAFVVNEYGDVAGMVTLEDAVEEIFGELRDEFDEEDDPILTIGGRVSGRGDVLRSTRRYQRILKRNADVEIEVDRPTVTHEHLEPGDIVHPDAEGPAFRVDEMDGRAVVRASFDESGADR